MADSLVLTDPPLDPGAAARRAAVQEVVRGWDRAFRLFLLYEGSNPAVERFTETMRRQTAALWEDSSSLTLTVEENSLRWGGTTVYAAESGTDSLAFLLFRDGIREMTLLPGFEADELAAWIALLARVYRVRGEEEDLLTLLWDGEWSCLRYRYVDPAAEGTQLPLASGSPSRPVEAPTRAEAEPIPAAIRPDDFQGALFFLDDAEIRRIADEMRAEFSRDLVSGVISALLDRFEDGEVERQRAILTIFADLLPVLLGAGQIERAAALVGELVDLSLASPPLPDEVLAGVRSLLARLAEADTLAELIRVAEEVPEVAASAHLTRLLGFLPGEALGPLLVLGDASGVPTVAAAIGAATTRLAEAHPERIPPLLDATDPERVAAAARLAGRLGRPEHTAALVRLLGNAASPVRLAAVEALQQLRSSAAAAALQRALADPEREVRIAAARALAELRYAPAREVLERVLDSRRLAEADLTERIAFYEAYGSVVGAAGVERLARVLNGRGWLGGRETPESRACAALALGRIALPPARDALAAAAADPDPVVRSAVGRALRGVPS